MEFKITSELENQLLKRREIELTATHIGEPTPGRKELIGGLSKFLKCSEDVIIPDKILVTGGIATSTLKLFVYNKKEDIPKRILELMEQRISGKKPQKVEAAPKQPEQKA